MGRRKLEKMFVTTVALGLTAGMVFQPLAANASNEVVDTEVVVESANTVDNTSENISEEVTEPVEEQVTETAGATEEVSEAPVVEGEEVSEAPVADGQEVIVESAETTEEAPVLEEVPADVDEAYIQKAENVIAEQEEIITEATEALATAEEEKQTAVEAQSAADEVKATADAELESAEAAAEQALKDAQAAGVNVDEAATAVEEAQKAADRADAMEGLINDVDSKAGQDRYLEVNNKIAENLIRLYICNKDTSVDPTDIVFDYDLTHLDWRRNSLTAKSKTTGEVIGYYNYETLNIWGVHVDVFYKTFTYQVSIIEKTSKTTYKGNIVLFEKNAVWGIKAPTYADTKAEYQKAINDARDNLTQAQATKTNVDKLADEYSKAKANADAKKAAAEEASNKAKAASEKVEAADKAIASQNEKLEKATKNKSFAEELLEKAKEALAAAKARAAANAAANSYYYRPSKSASTSANTTAVATTSTSDVESLSSVSIEDTMVPLAGEEVAEVAKSTPAKRNTNTIKIAGEEINVVSDATEEEEIVATTNKVAEGETIEIGAEETPLAAAPVKKSFRSIWFLILVIIAVLTGTGVYVKKKNTDK